ncbi:hypothetical protein [Lacticaseibacillus manihotivorans]|uniref:hypothetical protein n=1 Tax=Lacticaseibacillus manihotivorans TaxID=88233 RepID=UPI0006D0CD8D|nr:hypothetical protein [Lacticaseibacillus manihotivorans]
MSKPVSMIELFYDWVFVDMIAKVIELIHAESCRCGRCWQRWRTVGCWWGKFIKRRLHVKG